MGRLAALALLLSVCPSGVEVRLTGPGRIALSAKEAPLSDVLECVSRETGMTVQYDGLPAPRQRVSAAIEDATVAEAVATLLDGQGLDYALGVDSAGTGAGTLVVSSSGSGPSSSGGTRSARGRDRTLPEPIPEEVPDEAEAETEELPGADEAFEPGEPAGEGPGGLPLVPGLGVPPSGDTAPATFPGAGTASPFAPAAPSPLFPEPIVLTPTTR